jgi:predicted nuclease of predicted toxin-antitoxin system
MRILADENVPGPVVRALRDAGRDVLWAKEAMPGARDREVLARAQAEMRLMASWRSDLG